MYSGRVTIRNPGDGGYRVPAERIGRWQFDGERLFQDLKGDLVDRLGAFEDCKTFEEVNRVRKRYGLPEIKR